MEDQLVEQPAIGLLSDLGWTALSSHGTYRSLKPIGKTYDLRNP